MMSAGGFESPLRVAILWVMVDKAFVLTSFGVKDNSRFLYGVGRWKKAKGDKKQRLSEKKVLVTSSRSPCFHNTNSLSSLDLDRYREGRAEGGALVEPWRTRTPRTVNNEMRVERVGARIVSLRCDSSVSTTSAAYGFDEFVPIRSE